MKILFLGDSITEALRSRQYEGHVYGLGYGFVNQVAASLVLEDPLKYTIVNRGIGGNRVVDLYARVKTDVWNEAPDVLNILVGVNDVGHDFHENPNGVDIERFEKVYRMLIEDTKKALPNVKIILCEPFFLRGPLSDEQYEHFKGVYKHAALVKRLAEEYSLPFVALQKTLSEAAEKYGDDKVLYDGVHPVSLGAALIAKEWLSVFKKEV